MVLQGIEGGFSTTGIAKSITTPAGKAESTSSVQEFSQVLGGMVDKVNDLQVKADASIQDFLTGDSKGLHEVMIAVEKASVSFQLLNQVRNKALDAYHEIMRMQV